MSTLEMICHIAKEQPYYFTLAALGAAAALGGIMMVLGTAWALLDFWLRGEE